MGVVISSSFLRSSTFLPLIVPHLRIPYLEAYSLFVNGINCREYQVAGLSEVILVELSNEGSESTLQQALVSLGCDARKLAPYTFAITPNGRTFLEVKRALEKVGLVVRGQPTLSQRRW